LSNNDLLLDIGVSLALSSSRNYLIISLSEVFKGPTATLPTTVVRGIVVGVLGNSR